MVVPSRVALATLGATQDGVHERGGEGAAGDGADPGTGQAGEGRKVPRALSEPLRVICRALRAQRPDRSLAQDSRRGVPLSP